MISIANYSARLYAFSLREVGKTLFDNFTTLEAAFLTYHIY
jgi:hypothetical protein